MGRGTHVLVDEAEARVKSHELGAAALAGVRDGALEDAGGQVSTDLRGMGWPRTATRAIRWATTRGFASPMTLPGINKSILPVRPVDARLAERWYR